MRKTQRLLYVEEDQGQPGQIRFPSYWLYLSVSNSAVPKDINTDKETRKTKGESEKTLRKIE